MTYRYLNLNTTARDLTPVKVSRWYDHSARVWTGYAVNKAGDQISDAAHAHAKADVSIKLADYAIWED